MRQIDTSSMICGEASKSLDFVPPIIFVKKLSSQVYDSLVFFPFWKKKEFRSFGIRLQNIQNSRCYLKKELLF